MVVCAPLVYLVIRAAEGGSATFELVLGNSRAWHSALTTVLLAGSVAGSAVLIGVPTAWLTMGARIWARRTWIVLVVLPLAVPSFVAAYAWVSLVPGFSGFAAAWIVLTAATVPYVILPTAAALRGVDPAHEEVARTLGNAGPTAFLRAALPQLAPAVGGGALLAALYVVSDFGAVSILRVDTLSRTIYASYRASFDRSSAAVLALLLAALAILVVWIEQSARGRARRWRLATSAPREHSPVGLGKWTAPAYALLATVAAIGLGVPVVATIRQLAVGRSAGIDAADLGQAALTTVYYAAAGTAAALALAVPIGVLAARYNSAIARLIERLSYVGHALPGVVVGLAVVYIGIRVAPAVYQTVALLALAYAVLFVPKGVAAVRGSVSTVPPVLEDVARSLGRSHFQAFWSVTLRLAAPGIAAGTVLILLTVMKELPATLMLRPTGENSLATRLWTLTDVTAYAAAAPYSLSLILIGAIPAFLLAIPLVRRRGRSSSVLGPAAAGELEGAAL